MYFEPSNSDRSSMRETVGSIFSNVAGYLD